LNEPDEQIHPKPQKPFERALYDFMCMAKGRSQSLIIRYFLEQIITHSDICEQGSVLLYSPPSDQTKESVGALKLYDDRVATNVNSIAEFPGSDFEVNEGLAALVFRKRSPEFTLDAKAHPDFVPIENQDIGAIYCIPILLDDSEPFGIVSFHNPVASVKAIDEDKRKSMDIAVKVLEAMLSLAPVRLVPEATVFIVHGRNEGFLTELQDVLKSENIEYVVVQSLARTGQDLLTFIEERIRGCVAGFVLLTPDDEGRLYQFGEPLRQRARQNVIFEGGYLMALFRRTNRVCFLKQGDLEIPSDLNGLLMEHVSGQIDRQRIQLTLKDWGLISPTE